jgi:hypothetical protein
MEMVYVAHKFTDNPAANIERAKQITNALQRADTNSLYVTPLLALSHIASGELGYEKEMELCLALLDRCNCMIVASEISKGVQMEIDHCRQKGIPIQYLPP